MESGYDERCSKITIRPLLNIMQNIRRDFPNLNEMNRGKTLVYLDSAASAQKPRVVIDALNSAYLETYSNVHRGLHWLSEQSTFKYEEVRKKLQIF